MALAQQRHAEDRAIPDLLLHFLKSIFWISKDISDLNRSAFEHCSPDYATPPRLEWAAKSLFPVCGGAAVSRDSAIVRTLLTMHRRHIGIAQPRRRFRQC